ncbi:MAG: hypothetical protein H0T53_12850 [Herpetosiphonaceae bacterium]|nr:hypothetical protein [Herpetosiphonaceae bacterium]
MVRVRRSWMALLLVFACLILVAGAGTAQAQGKGKGPKKNPKITWSTARVTQTVNPGQTATVSASFSSSADLQNITLSIPGDLGTIVSVAPASIASLKAGEVATVTLTVTMPSSGAHSQGGVLKITQGKKSLPGSLKIKISVPGADPDK